MLYLWKITQAQVRGYDTYDSAVVVASTEEEARKIHPSNRQPYVGGDEGDWGHSYGEWPTSWKAVKAEKLGPLGNTEYRGGEVVVASFNAG